MVLLFGRHKSEVIRILAKAWAIAEVQLEYGTDTRHTLRVCSDVANELDIYKDVIQSMYMLKARLKNEK